MARVDSTRLCTVTLLNSRCHDQNVWTSAVVDESNVLAFVVPQGVAELPLVFFRDGWQRHFLCRLVHLVLVHRRACLLSRSMAL